MAEVRASSTLSGFLRTGGSNRRKPTGAPCALMGALGHGQVGWALGSWSLVVVEVHVVVEVRVEVEVQQQRVVAGRLVAGVEIQDEVPAGPLRVRFLRARRRLPLDFRRSVQLVRDCTK